MAPLGNHSNSMSERNSSHDLAIIRCKACPRLIRHCKNIAQKKKRAFQNEPYWGKPVPPLRADSVKLMIIGLAPAAHGANRTGRMFTGDQSGLWLYRELYEHGFSTRPDSVGAADDLKLIDCMITAAVKCAPPDNKPTPQEIDRCSRFLAQEIHQEPHTQIYLCLGKVALDAAWPLLNTAQLKKPKFGHGIWTQLGGGHQKKRWLVTSYHPSQQNTFTGKLNREMWRSVFAKIRSTLT